MHKEIQRKKGGGRVRVSSSHFIVVAFLRGGILLFIHSQFKPHLSSLQKDLWNLGVFFFATLQQNYT